MITITKRLLNISALALTAAALASAQYTCGNPASASTLMRAEGTTEQTADLVITCATSATGAATVAGSLNLVLSVSPALPVTSRVLNASGATEAVAFTGGAYVQGVVSGAGLLFAGVPTPACAAATVCTFALTISNTRVNATSLGAGPVTVSETALITAGGAPATVNPSLVPATAVGIVVNGLAPATLTDPATVSACAGTGTIPAPFFTLNFRENFSTAFKAQGDTTANAVPGAWTEPMLNTETGFTPAGFPAANSATRIKIVFANIPAGLTVYVPLSVASTVTGAGTAGSLQLVSSETGAYSPVTGSGALTATGGTATAIYEVTGQAGGANQTDVYAIPVTYTLAPGAIAAPVAAVTATVQFATGAAGNVPGFVTGSSSNTMTAPGVTVCNSVILFPYTTSAGGFDTGLAIANTSTDSLTPALNSVRAQSGACALNLYGQNAPAAAIQTPVVPTGTVYAATLSSLAPNFTGYVIANCNFRFGMGFAYISFDLVKGNGVSMGYLAIVLGPGGNR